MANSFLDRLAQFERSNILGGEVQKASAQLMVAEAEATDRVLQNVNKKISTLNNEIKTTDEQIEAINADPEAKQQVGNITEKVAKFQALQEKLNKQSAFINSVYGTAIAELGQIGGSEATNLAQLLGNQQKNKLREISNQLEVPLRQLEYEKAQSSLRWDKIQYEEALLTREEKQNTSVAMSEIMALPEFENIPAGDIRAWSKDQLINFNNSVNSVITAAKKRLPNISGSSIAKAFKLAMDYTGKSFKWEELTPNKIGDSTGITQGDVEATLSQLEMWSDQWVYMDEELKSQVTDYITTGKLPEYEDEEGKKYDKATIKKIGEIFEPGGKYYQRYNMLLGVDPNLRKKIKLQGASVELPENPMYRGIILPYNMSSFNDNSFYYSPAWLAKRKISGDAAVQDILNANVGVAEGESFLSEISRATRSREDQPSTLETFFDSIQQDFGIDLGIESITPDTTGTENGEK